MPNLNYTPDQYQYYSRVGSDGYQILSYIMSGENAKGVAEEKEVAFQNEDNARAFVYSRLPYKVSSAKDLKAFLNRYPHLKADPKQRAHRREMSEQARRKIADLAARKNFAIKGILDAQNDKPGSNPEYNKQNLPIVRDDYVLMGTDSSAEGVKRNIEIAKTMAFGTPEERGKLVEERVAKTMLLFDTMVNGDPTDEYILENFETLYEAQDMFVNAQKFRDQAIAGRIQISPETFENILLFEKCAPKADTLLQRMRAMANANYEYVNPMPILSLSQADTLPLSDYMEEINAPVELSDFSMLAEIFSTWLGSYRSTRLMMQLEKDFPQNKEQAKLKFIATNGTIKEVGYVGEGRNEELEANLYRSHFLATTPNGDAVCYRIDEKGNLKEEAAVDMLNDLASDMRGALALLEEANKGFFIGSKEYSNALKAVRQSSKSIDKKALPIVADEVTKTQLEGIMAACKSYMDNKDPENFSNDRERRRYEAMQKVSDSCRHQLKLIELQGEAVALAGNAAVNFHRSSKGVKMPEFSSADVFAKVNEKYSEFRVAGQEKGSAIPESNVGNAADNLRADIYENLSDMMSRAKFKPEKAREVMADMVLLELVKGSRTKNEQGQIVAGAMEQQLAKNPKEMREAFRKNTYVASFTEHVTVESLRNFVMKDGAKTVADAMTKVAKQQPAPASQAPAAEVKKEMAPPKV